MAACMPWGLGRAPLSRRTEEEQSRGEVLPGGEPGRRGPWEGRRGWAVGELLHVLQPQAPQFLLSWSRAGLLLCVFLRTFALPRVISLPWRLEMTNTPSP